MGTRAGVLVVCEGIPDALTAAGAGLRSVAVLGSQAPDRSVATRIARDADECDVRVVAVIDNDDAGRSWGARLTSLLAEHGVGLDVVEPPGAINDLNAWAIAEPELGDARWPCDSVATALEITGRHPDRVVALER